MKKQERVFVKVGTGYLFDRTTKSDKFLDIPQIANSFKYLKVLLW